MSVTSRPATVRDLETEYVERLLAVSDESIPAEVWERARVLILDGLACGFVGSRLPWSLQALAASVPDSAGAIVLGHDERVSLLESAFLNGTFIQGFELDDYHRDGPLHSSSVVLPAVFAASLRAGDLTLRDLLRAAIRGYETGPRLGMALGGGRVTVSGYHTGGVFGPAAAAMAAASILQLSTAQTTDAFRMACSRAAGLMAVQHGGTVKRANHGIASMGGLQAALLAEVGITGGSEILENSYGGLAQVVLRDTWNQHLSRLVDGVGTEWELLTIGIKRHACMIGIHPSIDAVLTHPDLEHLRADDIAAIDVRLSESIHKRTAWYLDPAQGVLAAQMSLPYALASAVVNRSAYVGQFTSEAIVDERVLDLMKRITATHDTSIDRLGPARRFVCELTVRLHSGATIEVTGDLRPAEELDPQDVLDKYDNLMEYVVDTSSAAALRSLVIDADLDTPAAELFSQLSAIRSRALPV